MDFDGQPQAAPDVTTRGMMTFDAQGCVAARYYLDVFPTLAASRPLAAATTRPPLLPRAACPALTGRGGTPELQPGAAASAGLPVARHRARPRHAPPRPALVARNK
jgi:hypothetical protein